MLSFQWESGDYFLKKVMYWLSYFLTEMGKIFWDVGMKTIHWYFLRENTQTLPELKTSLAFLMTFEAHVAKPVF